LAFELAKQVCGLGEELSRLTSHSMDVWLVIWALVASTISDLLSVVLCDHFITLQSFALFKELHFTQ
jgi:hypothetical protein